jgi:hypothetical protein
VNDLIAARAVEQCRREAREKEQVGDFFGSTKGAPKTLSLLLGSDDDVPEGAAETLAECRRLRGDISKHQFDIDSIQTE